MQEPSSSPGQRKYEAATARLRAGFTAIPNLVLRDPRLSGNAKALYAIMLDLAWRGEEPELPELGALIGAGEKVARRGIRELESVGLVAARRRGQGRTNAYTIHEPESQNGQIGRSRSSLMAVPTRAGENGGKTNYEDASVEAPDGASTSGGGRSQTRSQNRKRDPLFDALAAATRRQLDGMTRSAAREVGVARAEIAAALKAEGITTVEAAVEEIGRRARTYAREHPEWELTPTALAKWWPTLARRRAPTPTGPSPEPEQTPEERERTARIARGSLVMAGDTAAAQNEWAATDGAALDEDDFLAVIAAESPERRARLVAAREGARG